MFFQRFTCEQWKRYPSDLAPIACERIPIRTHPENRDLSENFVRRIADCSMKHLLDWADRHPTRAGALAGWYQQSCGMLVTAFTMPLILRNLTPDQAGMWFAFQSIMAFLNLTDFGFTQVISRQVAFSLHRTAEDGEPLDDFIHTSSGWVGIAELFVTGKRLFSWMNGIAVILIVVSYEFILPLGKLVEHRTIKTDLAWYCLGIGTLLTLQGKLYQGVLEGLGKFYAARTVAGTAQLLAGVLVVVGLSLKLGISILAGAMLAANALQLCALWWLLHLHAAGRLRNLRDIRPVPVCRVLRIAAPFGVLSIASFLFSAIQVPIIGSFLGAPAVAPYYLAQRLSGVLAGGILQLASPQLPFFTREISTCNYDAAAARMLKTLRAITLSSILGFAAYYFLTPELVILWLAKRAYVSNVVLLALSIDGIMLTVSVAFSHLVLASGRNPFLLTSLVAGLFNITGCLVMIKTFGVLGVAMSGLLAGVLTNYWFAPVQGFRLLYRLRNSAIEVHL